MKTQTAIELAGSASMLSGLLGISMSAISQWGDDIPKAREWQLRVIRPEWFAKTDKAAPATKAEAA